MNLKESRERSQPGRHAPVQAKAIEMGAAVLDPGAARGVVEACLATVVTGVEALAARHAG